MQRIRGGSDMSTLLVVVGYILLGIVAAGIANGLKFDDDFMPLIFLFWPVILVAWIVSGIIYAVFSFGCWIGKLFT